MWCWQVMLKPNVSGKKLKVGDVCLEVKVKVCIEVESPSHMLPRRDQPLAAELNGSGRYRLLAIHFAFRTTQPIPLYNMAAANHLEDSLLTSILLYEVSIGHTRNIVHFGACETSVVYRSPSTVTFSIPNLLVENWKSEAIAQGPISCAGSSIAFCRA